MAAPQRSDVFLQRKRGQTATAAMRGVRLCEAKQLAVWLVDHAPGEGIAESGGVRQPLYGLHGLAPAPHAPLGGLLLRPVVDDGDGPLALRPREDAVGANARLPRVPLHQARQEQLLRGLAHHHRRLQELSLGALQLLHHVLRRVHPQLQTCCSTPTNG
jgi:hypothetical protein|uniref:Uncharacterized protein n=1 Tax=Zea mays TaxID=4577 RepID=A0A804LN66_MAIZE